VDELEARLVSGGDLVGGVGVRGEDDRDVPFMEHLEELSGRVDLAHRLPQASRVHVHHDAGLGHRLSGLLEHARDVFIGKVAEDLYEVRVA
jgi:hypothetical protein